MCDALSGTYTSTEGLVLRGEGEADGLLSDPRLSSLPWLRNLRPTR